MKKPPECADAVVFVEQIVETLSERGNRGTLRKLGFQQGSDLEFCRGYALAGYLDHCWRDIYTQYIVTCARQLPGPDPASAPEVDYQPAGEAGLTQDLEQPRSRVSGEISKPCIVNVSKVVFIGIQCSVSRHIGVPFFT
jgi:hypothetical protein